MEPDKIGKFIANLRKEKNLNQQELANELYVSTKTISKWETGRGIPDLASLRKICEYFNITLEELKTYDFEMLPAKPYKGKMF